MSALVEAAQSWIGTPYVHQASAKGAGCDCLGLIRGLWRDVYGAEPADIPAYTPDWSEPQGEERLQNAATTLLQNADRLPWMAGQLLLFRMRQGAVAKHLGLLCATGEAPSFIHAYSGHGVIESPLSTPWRRRLAGRFAFPVQE